MKPSGIEWIGYIPDDWEVIKTKFLFNVYGGSTPKVNVPEYWGDKITWITPGELGDDIKIVLNSKRMLSEKGLNSCGATLAPKGSIIISNRAPIGQVCLAGSELCTNQGCKSLVAKIKLSCLFFYYFFKVQSEVLNMLGNGTTFMELSASDLLNFKIPFPPLKTQQKIADYLDEKCGEIDATIAKQKESIEKLKAYKQSLISETVTKGLDKSAPLKPSGIKWLGEIPQNARIIRLRFLSSIQTGDKDTVNRVENGKYPFYVRSPIVERIDTFSFDGEAILMAGDGVGAGKVFHYVNGKFDYHQRVYNIHNLKGVLGKFLYYYLRENFYKEIEQSNAKSTVDSIRLPMLLDFPIIVYPYDLQKEMVSFLDKKVAEIDAIIIKKQNIIQKLDAYKKSLIFECVTGKKRI